MWLLDWLDEEPIQIHWWTPERVLLDRGHPDFMSKYGFWTGSRRAGPDPLVDS